MIGDLILWFRETWRELFCGHDYQPQSTPRGILTWRECAKCKRGRDYVANF